MELALFLGLFLLWSVETSCKVVVSDCGKPDRSMALQSMTIAPDPILYPGNVSVTGTIDVLKDLPSNGLQMALDLEKLDPTPMAVPCLKNIGSCKYDACDMIKKNPEKFCPMFPPQVPCGCPLKAGRYTMNNVQVPIPNFGEIFAKILEGHYNGTITFVDTASQKQLGCFQMTFQITPRE